MKNYNWTQDLKAIYDKALGLYRGGNTELESYFHPEEIERLAELGLRPIHVFDHIEDFVNHGEPTWETFLLVAAARRDYFLYEQRGEVSKKTVWAADLPAKSESLEGVEWLPRILRKAECFLDGGLCHEIMFGCGGDRAFLKKYNVHPADFLRIVWASKGDATKVLAYLKH